MANVYDVFKQLEREQQIQLFAEEETIDSNEYCMLESDTTRKILIPEKYSIFGVESDEKVKTVKFAFPRYVDDGRLDLMDYQIRINYKTANPNEENNKDQTQAQNVHTVGDYIVFEWLLSRRVTQYKGTITFIVCAITANDDGTITTEWNTTLATSESIEGLEVSSNENEEEQARDLLTELLANLNNSKNDAITEITQTKTQAISDVEAEGQTQISAVDAKGGQVLESIPDDYTTLENRVDELEQNRAYAIVGNGSGEFVTLNDSSELKTRNVKLFGKSVQAETTGVQLFDINTAKNYDEAEITDYSSGTMEIEQNNSAMTQSPKLKEWCPTMQAGQSYLLTCETTSTKKYITIGSSQWNFGGVFIPTADDLEENVEWHCTTQRSTSGTIVYYRDTFAGIMIVEGTTEKPYEVYTGGEAATEPTPDYPLPITSAGIYDAEEEKYEIGILVANKNFASNVNVYSGYYSDSGGLSSAPDSRFIRVSKIKIIPGVKYRISSNLEIYNIWGYDVDNNPILRRGYGSLNTVSLNATDEEIYIGISLRNTSGQADTTAFEFIQAETGEEQTSYIDGKSQNTTLQIPNPLRGIPVDSGGNYTDAEGQQWLCDYIDRERGKYVQCVQETVLDGSEDEGWFYQSDTNTFASNYFGGVGINNRVCICDRFFSKQGINPQNVDYLCCGFHPLPQYSYYFYFKAIGEINFTLVSDFKRWLSNNHTTIIYQLKNQIETDLTPDQIAALNLFTYQGITNIGTDTMPKVGVDVEYIADTKTYIDNAIAEAIAAIPTE